MSLMLAIPETIEKKMRGTTFIFTRFRKIVPIKLITVIFSPKIIPKSIPSANPIKTLPVNPIFTFFMGQIPFFLQFKNNKRRFYTLLSGM